MPERVVKETRILAEDELIDISVTQVPVSSEIPHGKRDHKHVFENEAQEIEFNSPKELIDELMRLIENNRRIINEIKRC